MRGRSFSNRIRGRRVRAEDVAPSADSRLLLSACLLTPGRFASAFDFRKDGSFTYSYQGEIMLLGLTRLAEMGAKAGADATFEPSPCYRDDDAMSERKCTQQELKDQREAWEAERAEAAEKKKKDAEMMKVMLGGIDPSSPQAAEEFADRLRKQAGWNSVAYKGDGVFQVDFQIRGRIDHDFVFPTIERFPVANAFVVVNRRADGAVRVDAPGFAPASNGGGMGNFSQLMAMGAAMEAKKEGTPVPEQALEGTLTITTDGQILANNTEDGPLAVPGGQKLEWKINPRTGAAPTALIKLGS